MTETIPNPVFTARYQKNQIITKDTLEMAKQITEDLSVLVAAIEFGYQMAGVGMSATVANGVTLVKSQILGSENIGTVVNPPILNLAQLVTAARSQLAQSATVLVPGVSTPVAAPTVAGPSSVAPLQLEGDLSGGSPAISEPKVAGPSNVIQGRFGKKAASVPGDQGPMLA